MENNIFSPMEIDAIGEIMNISLGSSATAVSNMLDHRVDITTPKVTVIDSSEFSLGNLEPAIGVEIRYTSGLDGSNIMLLKRSDVKLIVDILMGSETPDDEFEFNELTISAVCEVMNQMMGASSTALSDFLGRLVNISTPESFELDNFEQFKQSHFPSNGGKVVVVRFLLRIEDALESEFINVMSMELARELISGFGLSEEANDPTPALPQIAPQAEQPPQSASAPSSGKMSQEEIELLLSGSVPTPPPAPAPVLAPAPTPASAPGASLSQEELDRLLAGAAGAPLPTQPQSPPTYAPPQPPPGYPGYYPPPQPGAGGEYPPVPPTPGQPDPNAAYPGYPVPGGYPPPYGYYPPPNYYQPPEPKRIPTQSVEMPSLDVATRLGEEQSKNLDLIMSVPLEVSVEIGRSQKRVQDILTFTKGSLVVLDKLAGDQVDLFVNGQCIARGDVVVIDDNFGIRITEILKNTELAELCHVK